MVAWQQALTLMSSQNIGWVLWPQRSYPSSLSGARPLARRCNITGILVCLQGLSGVCALAWGRVSYSNDSG